MARMTPSQLPSTAEGRLSLSTDPLPTADLTGRTTLYYTEYIGRNIAIFDGSSWNQQYIGSSGSTTLNLGTAIGGSPISSGVVYDVFGCVTGGALALELVAWSGNNRVTGIGRHAGGPIVKSGDATRRYLGTIRGSASGQCEDSAAKRFVWNWDNRCLRMSRQYETAGSWFVQSVSFIAMNGGSSYWKHEFVVGISVDPIMTRAKAWASRPNTTWPIMALGYDSTSTRDAGCMGSCVQGTGANFQMDTVLVKYPDAGYHYIQGMNRGVDASNQMTWYANDTDQLGGMFTEFVM